jgi:hypothetical protein
MTERTSRRPSVPLSPPHGGGRLVRRAAPLFLVAVEHVLGWLLWLLPLAIVGVVVGLAVAVAAGG